MKNRALKAMWWVSTSLFLAVVLLFVLLASVAGKFEDELSMGPFYGTKLTNSLSGLPASSLRLDDFHQLVVFTNASPLGPVLSLAKGTTPKWSRVMLPFRKTSEGSIQTNRVYWVNLRSLSRSDGGYNVDFTCYWDGGGDEAGRIYLSKDFSFQTFRINW